MKLPLLFFTAILLSSCNTPQQQANLQAADQSYCQSIGATGDKLPDCMIYRDQARRNDRQRRAEALVRASAQFNQLAQPPTRHVTTNCRMIGNQLNCISM